MHDREAGNPGKPSAEAAPAAGAGRYGLCPRHAVLAASRRRGTLFIHRPSAGHAWITDYGNPDVAEDFNWLLPLSPLHNVARPKDDGQYPAFLLTTGDHDDRVVPLHTLKLVATLQHTLAGGTFGSISV